MARLTVPDSTWVMVTSAPATGWPSALTTWPATPADVLCANTGAAASAAIRASDSRDRRARCGCDMTGPRCGRTAAGRDALRCPATENAGDSPTRTAAYGLTAV